MWKSPACATIALASFVWLCACADGPTNVADDQRRDEHTTDEAGRVFGIREGSRQATAILRVANEIDENSLNEDVPLDTRAAAAIVRGREANGYQSLEQLTALPFVKEEAIHNLLSFAEDSGLIGQPLSIATLNIKWYGLNGSLFQPFGSETRSSTIRTFITDNLLDNDVLVFQEIVDVDLFIDEVMYDRSCRTYAGFAGKHQHVVLCHTDDYQFQPIDDDGDFALEEVRFGNLRPALHGRLLTNTGTPVADIIGIHLKAFADSTQTRLEQTEVLAEYVQELQEASALPVIVIGDFNTYTTNETGLDEDDDVLMSEIYGDDLFLPDLPEATFITGNSKKLRLDQAWLSTTVDVLDTEVPGPCSLSPGTDDEAQEKYVAEVSDHCPVVLDLIL